MTRISQLFDLQQIDTGLDRRSARLRQIDEQMVDTPELVAARQAHAESQNLVNERQSALKRLTDEAEDVSRRAKGQEKRLYDGSIKNPKELGQIQEEVAHLKSRLKSLEDSEIDTMLLVEEADNALAERKNDLDQALKEWEQFQAGLLEERDKLVEQLKVLQTKRQKTMNEIPWADLQAYERLRRMKGGVAVAAVQDGSCGACRVGVPVHILRGARAGTEFTLCASCGRILYPTAEVKFKEIDHTMDNINR
jgi:predicted  nucleic acid-binding Zn-ribbon protein